MKKILFGLTLVASLVALSGCESRLDIPQKGVVPMEDYYKTDEDAEAALIGAYYTNARYYSNNGNSALGWNDSPFLSLWTYASDEIYAAGNNNADNVPQQEVHSFRFDNNNSVVTGVYQSWYQCIYSCNLVIDNFAGEKADTPIKKRCVAEARVLRAHAQLMLALGWGTAPIVDYVLSADAKPGNAESQEYVLEWIANECDLAMADNVLRERESASDKNGAVMVTKAFAQAVKGKALLSLKRWEDAKAALRPIVESDKYALVPSDQMEDLFHLEGDGCSESIFEFNLVWDASNGDYYMRTPLNQPILWNWRSEKMYMPNGDGTQVVNNGWGEVNPSKKFIETLLEHDGINSARRKAWVKSYDEVLYEMPYTSDATTTTMEAKVKDRSRGIHAADGLYGHIGWFMWKRNYRPSDLNPSQQIMYNFPIMRLPEVLLMYAEACAMTGDPDGSGLAALNRIQDRAQSQHRSTECTMEEVKVEKFLECWLECTRFQDLVRWGDAEKELGDNGTYYPSFCDGMFTNQEEEHRGYVDESNATWCIDRYGDKVGFKSGKHELFPFPFSEIQINPNIKQNPGWTTAAAE